MKLVVPVGALAAPLVAYETTALLLKLYRRKLWSLHPDVRRTFFLTEEVHRCLCFGGVENWSGRSGGATSLDGVPTRLGMPARRAPSAGEHSTPRDHPPLKGRSCSRSHFVSAAGHCQSPSIAACFSQLRPDTEIIRRPTLRSAGSSRMTPDRWSAAAGRPAPSERPEKCHVSSAGGALAGRRQPHCGSLTRCKSLRASVETLPQPVSALVARHNGHCTQPCTVYSCNCVRG